MRRFLLLMIATMLLVGCANVEFKADNTGPPRMITFGVVDPLADFDARMALSRVPLDIAGATIETCADLFAAIETKADLPSASETGSFADYEDCFELPLLCHAPVARDAAALFARERNGQGQHIKLAMPSGQKNASMVSSMESLMC